MTSQIQVVKLDGTVEPFSADKLLQSARRVGVPARLQPQLLEHISSHLYPNIPTKEIFALMKKFLVSHHPSSNLKYNLKQAILSLGPSGYPFEKYFALILTHLGYTTNTNQILQGKCVSHEIDILATKDFTTYLIEAKFHHQQHIKSNVKVALYVHSRYLDIRFAVKPSKKIKVWLVTNTRFTQDALTFAHCTSMRVTSWSYPKSEGLKDLIERTHLYPVTMLELPTHITQTLLQEGIVSCKQALNLPSSIPLSREAKKIVYNKAKLVCDS